MHLWPLASFFIDVLAAQLGALQRKVSFYRRFGVWEFFYRRVGSAPEAGKLFYRRFAVFIPGVLLYLKYLGPGWGRQKPSNIKNPKGFYCVLGISGPFLGPGRPGHAWGRRGPKIHQNGRGILGFLAFWSISGVPWAAVLFFLNHLFVEPSILELVQKAFRMWMITKSFSSKSHNVNSS